MARILQDGDWRLIYVYRRYRILHRCYEATYGWDSRGKKAWAAVGELVVTCNACDAVPPIEMLGFKNLLEWEK
jgi:hypothetical protein